MTSSLIIKDTHPIKRFTSISQLGLKAFNLASTYKTVMDARLPGSTESLAQDLDAFGVAIPSTIQTRHESVAGTVAQNARIRQGHTRVRAIRVMIRKAGASKEARKAYGVGQKLAPGVLKDVTAAVKQIVDRATTAPEEAAELGLGPVAVAGLTTFLASLKEADNTQENRRASAPLSTKERNMLGNRILQTVALIAGTGMLAFADEPTTYESFNELIEALKATAKSTKKKSAEPPKTPQVPASEDSSPSPAPEPPAG